MNEGKRGPNGGVIDIDDPHEVFPGKDELRVAIRQALSRVSFAAQERAAGRRQNEVLLLRHATRQLTDAIYSLALRETRLSEDG